MGSVWKMDQWLMPRIAAVPSSKAAKRLVVIEPKAKAAGAGFCYQPGLDFKMTKSHNSGSVPELLILGNKHPVEPLYLQFYAPDLKVHGGKNGGHAWKQNSYAVRSNVWRVMLVDENGIESLFMGPTSYNNPYPLAAIEIPPRDERRFHVYADHVVNGYYQMQIFGLWDQFQMKADSITVNLHLAGNISKTTKLNSTEEYEIQLGIDRDTLVQPKTSEEWLNWLSTSYAIPAITSAEAQFESLFTQQSCWRGSQSSAIITKTSQATPTKISDHSSRASRSRALRSRSRFSSVGCSRRHRSSSSVISKQSPSPMSIPSVPFTHVLDPCVPVQWSTTTIMKSNVNDHMDTQANDAFDLFDVDLMESIPHPILSTYQSITPIKTTISEISLDTPSLNLLPSTSTQILLPENTSVQTLCLNAQQLTPSSSHQLALSKRKSSPEPRTPTPIIQKLRPRPLRPVVEPKKKKGLFNLYELLM